MEEDFIQPQSVSEITGLSVAALAQLVSGARNPSAMAESSRRRH